jgi:hypothetical protein
MRPFRETDDVSLPGEPFERLTRAVPPGITWFGVIPTAKLPLVDSIGFADTVRVLTSIALAILDNITSKRAIANIVLRLDTIFI